MDWQSYLTPWTIGSAVFGLVLGVAALVGLILNRHQIGGAIAKAALTRLSFTLSAGPASSVNSLRRYSGTIWLFRHTRWKARYLSALTFAPLKGLEVRVCADASVATSTTAVALRAIVRIVWRIMSLFS